MFKARGFLQNFPRFWRNLYFKNPVKYERIFWINHAAARALHKLHNAINHIDHLTLTQDISVILLQNRQASLRLPKGSGGAAGSVNMALLQASKTPARNIPAGVASHTDLFV